MKVDFVIVTQNLVWANRAIETLKEEIPEYLSAIVLVMRQGRELGIGQEQGFRGTTEDFVCFLNDDCFVNRRAFRRMVEVMESDPKVAIVGPTIKCRTHQGFIPVADQPRTMDVPFIVWSCALVRRSAYEQVGGMDVEYQIMAGELDFCYRIRDAGYRIVWVQDVRVNHIGGASVQLIPTEEFAAINANDHARLERKFPGRMERESLELAARMEALVPGVVA